jgi:hypothetical protein
MTRMRFLDAAMELTLSQLSQGSGGTLDDLLIVEPTTFDSEDERRCKAYCSRSCGSF